MVADTCNTHGIGAIGCEPRREFVNARRGFATHVVNVVSWLVDGHVVLDSGPVKASCAVKSIKGKFFFLLYRVSLGRCA